MHQDFRFRKILSIDSVRIESFVDGFFHQL